MAEQRFGVSREVVRKQWALATEFLLEKQYLLQGSMAGSSTYRWVSKEHFRKARRWYGNIASPEMDAQAAD